MDRSAGRRPTDQAAAEPQRERLLLALEHAADGLDVTELADRLGLHPNTVRWHLGRLADAGLVSSHPLHRGRPGRPRIVYEATGGRAGPGDGYRFLAEMLASALHAAPGGSEDAVSAGRAWGRYLVEAPPPFQRPTPAEATAEVAGLLSAHGFAARSKGGAIEMRRCPFHDVVDAYGDVVCGLHRGLIEGALETLDAGLTLSSLEVYPEPGMCRARLSAAAGNMGSS